MYDKMNTRWVDKRRKKEKERDDKEMKLEKGNETEFIPNEVSTKIVTYDGMYYTIAKHSQEEILDFKNTYESEYNESISISEVIDELVTQDLLGIIVKPDEELLKQVIITEDGLIYLPYERKLINRKEIKESFVQIN